MKPLDYSAELPATFVVGARVVALANDRRGTITRVIDGSGHMAGLVEVRWDGQRRASRSAGFFGGIELRLDSPECSGCATCSPAHAAADLAEMAS